MVLIYVYLEVHIVYVHTYEHNTACRLWNSGVPAAAEAKILERLSC